MIQKLGFILFFFFTSFVELQAKDKIKIATLQWPPYTCSDCESGGVTAKVLKDFFSKQQIEVELVFYPWVRALKLSENNQVDALWPCWTNDVLGTSLKVGVPFFKSTLGFVTRPDNQIELVQISDLKKYRIGAVSGYGYDSDILTILKNSSSKVQYVNDDKANLKKLVAKRIDVALIDLVNFDYSLKFLSTNEKEQLVVQKKLQRSLDLSLCFSEKNYDKYNEMIKKGLHSFDFEKKLAEELKKHSEAPQAQGDKNKNYRLVIKP